MLQIPSWKKWLRKLGFLFSASGFGQNHSFLYHQCVYILRQILFLLLFFQLPSVRWLAQTVQTTYLVFLVMANSLRPHGLQPIRLLCPWNAGVGCHSYSRDLLTQRMNPCLLCLLHYRQILYPWEAQTTFTRS